MDFYSTRNKSFRLSGEQAVIAGIAPDGGLFLPCELPRYGREELERMKSLDYVSLAAKVMAFFFPGIGEQKLLAACREAYAPEKFGGECPVRLHELDGNTVMLELWHGPTLAFKDMALQMLPHLLSLSLEATGDGRRALILTATSGDTGKAALEGFTNVPGTQVAVFYPAYGVSEMQRLQMATHRAKNVAVFAIDGNFDDTQTAVKRMFADSSLQKEASANGAFLSSANSINVGRLIPQIVYYIYAYLRLVSQGHITLGDAVDIAVPTGNFGNILAAWLAGRMGIPVKTLICASNRNNILTDFFRTGVYDTRRPFYKTGSPSMDILVSSNLERLLFYLYGEDDGACADLMRQLSETGCYRLSPQALQRAQEMFFAACADDEQTIACIGKVWKSLGYCVDPHTAVALCALSQRSDSSLTLVASTASPYKFSSTVLRGLGQAPSQDEFENLERLAGILHEQPPERLRELRELPLRFDQVFSKERMPDLVRGLFKN